MSMTRSSARPGFALPVVILAMFLLVGALASGFAMIRGETAADDAALQMQSAAALAESGLQQAFNNRAGLGLAALPTGTDSARLTLTGGYADVITTVLRAPVGKTVPGLYYIRVRGVRTATGVAGAGNAVAFASGFAQYNPITLTIQSAMTGANGIDKNGNSGTISGVDQCAVADGGGQPTLPAIAVPADPGYEGKTTPLEGNPKIDTIGNTPEEAAGTIPIDWEAIVYEDAISATFDLPADGTGFPDDAWFTANPSAYPTIIVRNGPDPSTMFSMNVTGRGLLIIFGDVNLNGNAAGWDGIILVGGSLTSNGTNQVRGATITGLNVKLGFTVTENDVNELNGTKQFLYHSCNVTKAMQNSNSGALRSYQNSWANSFPSY
jgi:hypothetical protein